MAYETNQTSTAPGIVVPLGARAEILPNAPLNDLNCVGGPAFSARMKGESASDLMAVLCNRGLPERSDLINSIRSIDHPSILRYIDSGVVHWPADDTRYFSFVYQRPLAPRMMSSLDEVHPVMSEDALNHYFIAPMIGALSELMRTGVVHNAIRPTNIFWRIGSTTPPQLGDCLSAPAGYGQPVIFESLERALSHPLGRGPGHHVDDCYAFGITLAFLLLGQNPFQGMDEATVIQMKNERGTFGTIVGNRRLPAGHIELLRGLLTDDSRQRWTALDLEQWQAGRRSTPKNSDLGRRAPRHFDFAGKEYWQMRPLAHAFFNNVAEAVQVIENGSLDKWLRRAMGDEERANNLMEVQDALKSSGKTANYQDQLVARICIVLDPTGPLRYRGLSVMPAGVATMLIDAVLTGNNIQALSEIISSQLVTVWVEMQKDVKTEMVPLAQTYERMRGIIEKTTFGNGFERVIYELNPTLNCLSPLLRKQYVTTPRFMLPALERIATSSQRTREPMDRHIAAFLIVRDRRSEMLFHAMSAPDGSSRRGLTMLGLYAEMQQRHGPDALPGLAAWLLPLFESSTRRFLGKAMREKTQAQIKQVAERGDLVMLQRLLDDPGRIEHDEQEFMAARMLYFNIMKEINSLESQIANRDSVVRVVGKPMAATLSSLLAIFLAIIILLRAVWQHLS